MAVATSHSDSELIQILKQGKTDSMHIIYHTYFGMIEALIKKNGGNEDDADFIFQEVVYILYCSVKKAKFVLKDKLKVVVYSIARNLWFNELRRRGVAHPEIKNIGPSIKVEMTSYAELSYSQNPEFTKVEKSYRILGDACKNLLSLYYFHHKSPSEIADELGSSESEVIAQKHRCIQNLKRMLL